MPFFTAHLNVYYTVSTKKTKANYFLHSVIKPQLNAIIFGTTT